MSNIANIGNITVLRAVGVISERLPPGWRISALEDEPKALYRPDALLTLRAPDGVTARIALETKRSITAASAAAIAPKLRESARENQATPLVVTSYLSPIARDRLSGADVSYLDLTGNARIVIERPGLFVESSGADRDPAPTQRGIRSLKGGAAASIVRALCDWRPPVGVRELARRAKTNAGYTTRVLSFLEQDDVVGRDKGGHVSSVRWQGLVRRWTQDYAVTRSNRFGLFLDPRGSDAFVARLRSYDGRSAITGSRAVPPEAATAPARIVSCYVPSIEEAADALDVRSVDAGGNVLLLEPFDDVVWQRSRREGSLTFVALSQCAADLMTGAGREPSEAEGLIAWMAKNESTWRA